MIKQKHKIKKQGAKIRPKLGYATSHIKSDELETKPFGVGGAGAYNKKLNNAS